MCSALVAGPGSRSKPANMGGGNRRWSVRTLLGLTGTQPDNTIGQSPTISSLHNTTAALVGLLCTCTCTAVLWFIARMQMQQSVCGSVNPGCCCCHGGMSGIGVAACTHAHREASNAMCQLLIQHTCQAHHLKSPHIIDTWEYMEQQHCSAVAAQPPALPCSY